MHMRYGNADSSFRELLNLSNAPENRLVLIQERLCTGCVWLRFVEIVVVSQTI